MSFYRARVGVVKIKQEFIQEMEYLFREEYDKITDKEFKKFISYYKKDLIKKPIRKWTHNNAKGEWLGKYKTSFENGILTFGVYYNSSGGNMKWYVDAFEDIVFGYIAEEELVDEYWDEDDLWKKDNTLKNIE
ncbi:MAG: hypothetical protein J6A73_05920 [Lachnospiraceae bacterium]|nr:hypothetical protein [Lachnospiraceae bacterium]